MMQNHNGQQKGPQDHAEGGHGSKTHSKIIEQLQSGHKEAAPIPTPLAHEGAHRLKEERKQHDIAEKRSEKTRLSREVERGHLPAEEL